MQRPPAGGGVGASVLIAGWMLLVGLYAGVFAWLFMNADDTMSRRTMEQARIEMPLPGLGETMTVSSEPVAAAMPRQSTPFGMGQILPPPKEAPTPTPPPTIAMTPIDATLLETAPAGLLPTIAPDGRQPWRFYARPFSDPLNRPRIAVMMTGVGLNAIASEAAIDRLPSDVSIAFTPYADIAKLTEMARRDGHEFFMSLPLEPLNYPQHDPGPYTLLTALSERENLARLEWVMGRSAGYVGLVGEFGSRFTTRSTTMLPVLEQVKRRGLMFVDAMASPDSVAMRVGRDLAIPRASNDRTIDVDASRAEIDAQIAQAEKLARASGQAVIFASPHLVTIDRLTEWLPTLAKKGLVLAPVSAIVGRQPDL